MNLKQLVIANSPLLLAAKVETLKLIALCIPHDENISCSKLFFLPATPFSALWMRLKISVFLFSFFLVYLMIYRYDFCSWFFQVWFVLIFSHSSSRRVSCRWSGFLSVLSGKYSPFSTTGKIHAWIGNYYIVQLGLLGFG